MENSKNKKFLKEITKYFENYKKSLKVKKKSENTILSYNSTINSFIDFVEQYEETISFKKLKENNFIDFLIYKEALVQKHFFELKGSSKNLFIIHLKKFFSFIQKASDKNYDFSDAFEDMKVEVPERIAKGLEVEEVDKILNHLESAIEKSNNYIPSKSRTGNPEFKKNKQFVAYRNALITKIYLYSGIRASELIGLNINDFHLENDLYTITVIGKGNKEARVYLEPAMVEKEIEFFIKNNLEIITLTINNKVLDRVQIWQMLKTVYAKADVDKSSIHILRHTFAKSVYSATKDIGTVKEMLRHKSINTTTIYAKESEQTTKNNYKKTFNK